VEAAVNLAKGVLALEDKNGNAGDLFDDVDNSRPAPPKILIVDDQEVNVFALRSALSHLNAELIGCNSGEDALAILLRQEIAVVLLDVQMPIMDGYEVAELMAHNETTAHIPVIFVTAISTEKRHMLKGYKSGAVDYICKPVDVDILLAKMHSFLQLYNQRQELQREVKRRTRAERELRESNSGLERALETLRQTQLKLMHASKLAALGEMATGLSHELNQPLTHIKGTLQIFEMKLFDGESVAGDRQLALVSESCRQVNKINEVINHLRAFGGSDTNADGSAEVNAVIGSALLFFSQRMKDQAIELRVDVQPPELALPIDNAKLEQILVNLIQNAIDAMLQETVERRELTISAKLDDNGDDTMAVLAVADTGVGILVDFRDKVFEPFFSTKEFGEGVGLGLSVVHGIVRESHGSVVVESEEGQGTTLVIRLPLSVA